MTQGREIVVAGHICLDLIPEVAGGAESLAALLRPGSLVNVGPAVMSTGGCVANAGLALHKIGEAVRLVGKVGDDAFGEAILHILNRHGGHLARHMVVDATGHSSYTVVISPPGIDRVFLHHPGTNDTFASGDVREEHLAGAGLFHFGYPPIMRAIYRDDGAELEAILRHAKARGMVTSLDMSMPDPNSESGRLDWPRLLERVLPHVDVFLPSLDEIAFMLREDAKLGTESLRRIAGRLIGWGAAVVVLKLGEAGLYLRTTEEAKRLECLRAAGVNPGEWRGREVAAPCWRADVVGTTGAGDCTIAGFLAELNRGAAPERVLAFATAVGACSTEAPDATGGVRPRAEVLRRMQAGWERHQAADAFAGWREANGACIGGLDRSGAQAPNN